MVRGALADALAGRLAVLDGAVFPHTCDAIQRLSDIWRINIPISFHTDVLVPAKLDSDSAAAYFNAVLLRFAHDLASALGRPISRDALADAIAVFNRLRTALGRLDAMRAERPGSIGGADWHAVQRAVSIMDRTAAADLAEALVAAAADAPPDAGSGGKRVVLAGGLCTLPDLYTLIEAAGGQVVGDDLCSGSRAFEGVVDLRSDDLIAAVAERYRLRSACPAKHAGLHSRPDRLLDLARRRRADGVVIVFPKFCDPHQFDVPLLKGALDGAGLPGLVLEIETQLPPGGQLQTRCEAFLEML